MNNLCAYLYSRHWRNWLLLPVWLLCTTLPLKAADTPRQEWEKLLDDAYYQMFYDAYQARITIDSLRSVADRTSNVAMMHQCNAVHSLMTLFQNDEKGAEKLFRDAEKTFLARKEFGTLALYETRKGTIIMNKLRFKDAEKCFKKALNYYTQANDRENIAEAHYKLAMLYRFDNREGEELEMISKGLHYAEKHNLKDAIRKGYLNLGDLLMNFYRDPKAIPCLEKARALSLRDGDSSLASNASIYLSTYYREQKNWGKCFTYAQEASSYLFRHPEEGIFSSMCELLSEYYIDKLQYDSALFYANRTLENRQKVQDNTGISMAMLLRANIFTKQKKYNDAKKEVTGCINVYHRTGVQPQLADAWKLLAELEAKTGNMGNAYNAMTNYALIIDSVYKKELGDEFTKIEASFANEKKELEIKNLKRQKKLDKYQLSVSQQRVAVQNRQKIILIVILVLACGFLFFVWRNYWQKKKDNLVIKRQRDQVAIQKKVLEEKNKEILDSINYAKLLQDAIVPSREKLNVAFKDHFVFYRPKEIVAGDFYWIETRGDKIFFAVCDCTGHGVPGAMVSMVGHNALNRCIMEFTLTDPGKILDKLSVLVEEAFSHNMHLKDGMDIALVCIDKNKKELSFAGAHNPIWIQQNGEITEINPDKQPVGKFENRKSFTTHTIHLQSGQRIYLFTDGYADQFGLTDDMKGRIEKLSGAAISAQEKQVQTKLSRGKKLGYKGLKSILLSTGHYPAAQQEKLISEMFDKWKGDFEQIDDVCVAGIDIL